MEAPAKHELIDFEHFKDWLKQAELRYGRAAHLTWGGLRRLLNEYEKDYMVRQEDNDK